MARKCALEISNTPFKLGDILTGTTYWYCTRPHFYKIVGFKGKKTIVVVELSKKYRTPYQSNSPAYECVPAGFNEDEFPYGCSGRGEITECRAYPFVNDRPFLKVGTGKYDHVWAELWDGTPQFGNCD